MILYELAKNKRGGFMPKVYLRAEGNVKHYLRFYSESGRRIVCETIKISVLSRDYSGDFSFFKTCNVKFNDVTLEQGGISGYVMVEYIGCHISDCPNFLFEIKWDEES